MIERGTIAVVGASARAAAFSALRAGWHVQTADLFADADLQRVAAATRIENYPHALLQWLEHCECDGWIYTGALENQPQLIERLASVRPLWGNNASVLQAARSPTNLPAALAGVDCRMPEIRSNANGLPRDGSWLVKPLASYGGQGIERLRDATEFCTETHYLQQFVTGDCASAVFVGSKTGASLFGITKQLAGRLWTTEEFCYRGNIAPLKVEAPIACKIVGIGNALSSACGLRGIFGVDFIIAGDEVSVLEVNPRYTAAVEVIERIRGESAIDANVTACTDGNCVSPTSGTQGHDSRPQVVGKAILYGDRCLRVSRRLSERLLDEAGTPRCPQLADIPRPGAEIKPGEPVLTTFVEGESCAEVERALMHRVANVAESIYREAAIARI